MAINTPTASTAGSSQYIKRSSTMKLHSSKTDLFQGIQTVLSAISVRSTLPVLSNILFEATDKGLRLSATDLEVGIRTWVKADVVEKGAITIPAKILGDFLKTLEDDREVKLESSENGKVEIRSGRDRLNITGLPKEDYPVLPEFDEAKSINIPQSVVREIFKKTTFAASTDETRYVLNGVHVIVDQGKATAVATDGRRLAFIQRPIPDKNLQIKVIVPTKAVHEVMRLVTDEKAGQTDLRVSFTENQASFSDGKTVVLSRLIEGHFPNFEQVIPKSKEIQIRLNRLSLLSSVTRVAVGTLERGGSIRLTLSKGTLKIQASAQGRVEVESELPTNYEGAELEVAFNPLYISDVLKALDQNDVLIELTTALNPGVIRPADDENYRYVMMPMKI